MAMKMGDQDDILAEINLTPFIDVMLVLLIIFMVTSSVSLESGLDINLPKTKSGRSKQKSSSVIVSLDNSGQISVQGSQVTEANLEAAIKTALAAEGSQTVVLEGDQRATLGRAIEIMDVAKAAGAEKFAIAADGN